MNAQTTEPIRSQTGPGAAEEDSNFISIDDPNVQWPSFMRSMLRIGRILTEKDPERRELTAAQISRAMNRHRNEVGDIYTGKEIRTLIHYYNCFFAGGGIQVEAFELDCMRRTQSVSHYHFTFTRLTPKTDQTEVTDQPKEEAK